MSNKEKIEIHSLDITDSDNVKKLFVDLKLDILVNNAGIGFRGKIIDTDMQVHKKIMNVNYFGQVEVTNSWLKLFFPHIKFQLCHFQTQLLINKTFVLKVLFLPY